MVSERTVADLQRRLLAAQSEAVNERDKRRNQVAERDRRIAALEAAMNPQDVADVDAALAGKGVSRA